MWSRTALLLSIYFGLSVGHGLGQTIPPPDLLTMTALAKTDPGQLPATLSAEESRARVTEAIQGIDAGKYDAALQALSGHSFILPDSRLINVLRASCFLGKGELRKAFDEARAGEIVGREGTLGARIALIKASVFSKPGANVLPLSFDSAI